MQSTAIAVEIARLTDAIAQAKSHPHAVSDYVPPSRGRGGRGRGRGGYGAPVVVHRNATWVAPGLDGTSRPANAASTSATTGTGPTTTTPSVAPGFIPAGTRGRGLYRNRKLVLNREGQAVSSEGGLIASTSASSTAPGSVVAGSGTASKEITIGGVSFIRDPRGNKLIRKSGPSPPPTFLSPSLRGKTKLHSDPFILLPSATGTTTSSTGSLSTSDPTSTPKRTEVSGTTYVRTKSGNLVSLDYAKRKKELGESKANSEKRDRLDRLVGIIKDVQGARDGAVGRGRSRGRGRGRGRGGFSRPTPKRSTKLCRFFQKTGQCNNGLTCPYTHDSNKVAICPASLRSKCPNRASDCLLSHSPNGHRSPHCTHFPNCKNGTSCAYSHVHVARDAGVCDEFARMGWCEKGLECTMRHAFECPEFSEKGTCGTLGCKLPHVLRRRNAAGVEEEEEEEDEVEGEGLHGWEEKEPRGRKRSALEELDGISGAAGRSRQNKRILLEGAEDEISLGNYDDEEEEEEEDEEDSEDDAASIDSTDLIEIGHEQDGVFIELSDEEAVVEDAPVEEDED